MPPLRTESYYPPPRTLPPTQGYHGCSEGGGKGRSSVVGVRPPDGDVCADGRGDSAAAGTAGADGPARDYVLFRTATTGSVGSSDAGAATTDATFANAASTRTL